MAVTFLFCILKKLWNLMVEGRCFNYSTYFLFGTITDLLINIILLCIPLWVISHLQLQIKHQVGVAFIFLLGGLQAAFRISFPY